jgi:Poxvirus A22 protein
MLLSIDVGIKNLAMCLIDPKTRKIKQWEVDGVPPNHSDGLYLSLIKHLNKKPWILESRQVLIEKQPDRNKGMKSVEHLLHAYLLAKDDTREVIVWDARFKVPDIAGAGKIKYAARKAASIERARKFIKETNPDWVAYFEKHKKKDDLADTVMQALSFLNRPGATKPEEPERERKLTPRKPTENQKRTKYSKANLAWIVKTGAPQDARFKKDLARYYKDLDELKADFNI